MRRPVESPTWPESWQISYRFDAIEIYDHAPRSAYAHMYRTRRDAALDCMQRWVPRGSRVLDVAAAQGNFTLALAELGYDVTWNDLRSELSEYVRAKYERGRVSYLPGNVLDLALNEPFDAVLLTEVIEHVAHPDQFLSRIANLLRPGGWIVLTTPNGGYLRNRLPRFSDCAHPEQFEALQFKPDVDGHIFLLHDDEIVTLAGRVGLEVRELRHFCNPLTSGHMKLASVLDRIPRGWVEALERMTAALPGAVGRKVNFGTLAALRKR